MNNNIFSTNTTFNDDYMLFPYNDHYSSQPLLPFSPSSSINDILLHSTSNTSNNHLDHHHHHHNHHHQFLQASSPLSQFEFVPDFSLLPSFLPQNNGHDDNQTIPTNDHHHHTSLLLPMNNPIRDQPIEPSETITNIEDSQRISASQYSQMKSVKKPIRTDRHSKIKTAKGTRDRRMRLSLDVAKELFGLQDMLGFDKASKTVEWLLTQAKPEIIKIAKTLPHQCGFSSGDESQTRPALGSIETSSDLCELASMWNADDIGSNINYTTELQENKVDGRSMRGKRNNSQPRTPILKKLSKDARDKARERAKYRTNEKMIMKRRLQVNKVIEEEAHHGHVEIIKNNNDDLNSNWSSLEAISCEEEIDELYKKNSFAVCNEFVMNQEEERISDLSYDIIKKLNSPFPMVNYHRSQGVATSIEHQHQFTDLHHVLGKPRDLVYNYHNM